MPNRLAGATSPYLLQHADNPVDWHQWGTGAFDEARRREVPIMLSVGYSACHWCHVMAHESFEDPDTAEEMNRLFVNVKVDREERPDVDSVYMEAVQAMTGRGGWPMTVWLTPDGRPFYAGTYFPRTDRPGMPSFRRVMRGVSDAWHNRREEVLRQSDQLTQAISRDIPGNATAPSVELLVGAYRAIAESFDPADGGFGGAPKFPQEPLLDFLLRVRGEPWAPRADEMLQTTLTHMADGGIHDHLAGGFARYSVDDHWLVPHFEKMLYDNAQLARLYLWSGIELNQPRFVEVARSTIDYLLRYLRHPSGAFYSAEDADSEGIEGKFYLWTPDDLAKALDEEQAAEAARFFGVTADGNFEGANVLHRPTGEPWTEFTHSMRTRLFEYRDQRVRPGLDDKIVSSWNGLTLRALAEAGAVLGEETHLQAARSCARFLTDHLIVDGTLMRSWRQGRALIPGFLDDYAAVATGLFQLYAATGEYEWYQSAEGLVRDILNLFAGPDGVLYDSTEGNGQLVKRPRSLVDNPLPSGSALAAEALFQLHSYTGDTNLGDAVQDVLRAAGALMDRFPSMVSAHLSVLHATLNARELAVVGPDWPELGRPYWEGYRPHVVLAPSADGSEPIPLLRDRAGDGTRAFLCQGQVCDLPSSDLREIRTRLLGT